jgi:metal-responsive CopG/Arc/MetJ family transcriptional regulator
MKVKTSISLSEEVLREIDRHSGASNRSAFIEEAVWERIQADRRRAIGERDRALIAEHLEELNAEAEDVLRFGAPWDESQP